jgi:CubicO group peptidase (beta-lactamase class C family)
VHAALELTQQWPVDNVSAVVVVPRDAADPQVHTVGDGDRPYRIASIGKTVVGWVAMVAVEEGIVSLDDPLGQPGCTLRHLLSHAGGYAFDGPDPIARPGTRRIYSNTGIEMVADEIARAAAMPFVQYLQDAVLDPLSMSSTELRGSPAYAMWSTARDLTAFVVELLSPTLITRESADCATTPAFADLAGIIPGLGRYSPCPWGLTFEVRGDKTPHWTGTRNSHETFGHFGGAGTFLWVDRGPVGGRPVGCAALTDRPFDEWAAEALTLWPRFSDAVIAEAAAA